VDDANNSEDDGIVPDGLSRKSLDPGIQEVSRPLLQLTMWRYWFHLSRYVYGGNRSFAPILRQSRWSLLYDVY
jgi:hypothetical protein